MEDEERNEKDIAMNERMKTFEEMIFFTVNNMMAEGKDETNIELKLPANVAKLDIVIKKEENSFTLKILNIDIGKIQGGKIQDGKLEDANMEYNIEGLEKVRDMLEKNGFRYDDLGLPDIEYLKELEKDKEKDKDKDPDGEEIGDGKEQGEEENPENDFDEDEQGDDKEQGEEEKPKDDRKQVTYLNYELVRRFIPSAGKYSSIGVTLDRQIVGKNKQTGELEPVEGLVTKSMNTDKEIHGTGENGEHTEINAEKVYKIGSSRFGFAIDDAAVKGNRNVKLVSFSRDENEKEGIVFYDIDLLESQGKTGPTQLRDKTGLYEGTRSGDRADENMDIFDEIQEEESVPNELKKNFANKIQDEDKLITEPRRLKEILIDSIEQTLDEKYGEATPGQHRNIAEKMATEIVDNQRDVEDVFTQYFGKEDGKDAQDKAVLHDHNRYGE